MQVNYEKKRYGLIGKRLDYSFSKEYFTQKFEDEKIDASYENYELEDLADCKNRLNQKSLSGFNITTPFKENILNWADTLTSVVQEVGAANCIRLTEKSEWIAHNTDVIGFEKSLKSFLQNEHPKALIFGSGGASKAVQYVLRKMNITYQIVSRSIQADYLSYEGLTGEIILEHKLLINTTPVGTYPNVEECINIPFQFIGATHFCYDLIYNPELSSFLTRALEQQAQVKNGREMLDIQAEESWNIWNASSEMKK